MWDVTFTRIPVLLFVQCSGPDENFLSNFDKLCPSHTHTECSEKKNYLHSPWEKDYAIWVGCRIENKALTF